MAQEGAHRGERDSGQLESQGSGRNQTTNPRKVSSDTAQVRDTQGTDRWRVAKNL